MNLDHLFGYHPHPTDIPQVKLTHERINRQMRETAGMVVVNTPECAEQTVSIRKLQEAMFWANAAVARNHEHYVDGSA